MSINFEDLKTRVENHRNNYKNDAEDGDSQHQTTVLMVGLLEKGVPEDFGRMIYHDENIADQFTFVRYTDSPHPYLVVIPQTKTALLAKNEMEAPEQFSSIEEGWAAFLETSRPATIEEAAPEAPEAPEPSKEEGQD